MLLFLGLLTTVAGSGEADCGVLPMVTWAGEQSRRAEPLARPVDTVVIQHTATAEGLDDADCDSIVKAIRNFHMRDMKFDDIGQSFLICGNGRVYEGAGWTHVGAHTRGYNRRSVGVSFVGNFATKLPTQQALNAALDLLTCGVKNNHLTENYKVVGHRQVSKTVSPGDALQNELKNWAHWTNVPY